jgi:hypothetical protein
MGAIQSAVNQALGTAGTIAGLGKLAKSQEESTDIQRQVMEQAERRFAEEQKLKELKLEKMEKSGQELINEATRISSRKGNIPARDAEVAREGQYTAEQLEQQYLELGDIKKASEMNRASSMYDAIMKRQLEAMDRVEQAKLAKQQQQKRSEEFRSMFTEGGRYK